jgi:PleD family two-component response regulator
LRDPSWSDGLSVTGSFGVVQWQEDSPLHMAINQADAAMYEAKNAGRNRVHLSANRLAAMTL